VADWVDVPDDEWTDVPEGGAEGGGGSDSAPSKPFIPTKLEAPKSAAEQKYAKQRLAADISGGQSLAHMPDGDLEAYQERNDTGAAAEALSLLSGAPLVGPFLDEIFGAVQSRSLSGSEYEAAKKMAQDAIGGSRKHSPSGALVGSMALGPPMPASALGRIGTATTVGAAEGAGEAPTIVDMPRMALKGGGAGLGAGLAGEAIRAAGSPLRKRATELHGKTHASELATETEAREAAARSAVSTEGGRTAASMKTWDRLEDAMFNPAATEESKAAARAFIQSPEGRALYNQVLANYVDDAPKQMGRLTSAREARLAAEAANNPDLIKQAAADAANAKLNDLSGVTGRLTEMGRRYIPPAIGGALAGPAGATAGGVIAGTMGKPGTIMSNMLKSPSMYRPLNAGADLLEGGGEVMSRAASPLGEWASMLSEEEQP
jgi:hypothetical protein